MVDNAAANNYRNPVITEPLLMPSNGFSGYGASGEGILHTPAGNVRALPPPLPPQAGLQQTTYGMNGYNNFGTGFGGGGGFSNFGGGYSGYGGYGGLGGFGGFGSYGAGGGYNRFGAMNPLDPESRFIQLAEASSRPAFQSIESLVSAIGNIAAMLDSTFFALTSSFRAILGVAANFGRLRGVFAQFWQTFAVFRGLNWIYRKILYWLRISNMDPSSAAFKKAFAEAVNETSTQAGAPKLPRKGQSPWPVLAFLSFIFTAPYLIMKLLGTVTNTAHEEARNPSKWVKPIETIAIYDFQARNASELTIRAGERIVIAPKEIQNTLGLLNTGWGLATTNGEVSGIVPINYVKSPQQMRNEQANMGLPQQQSQQELITKHLTTTPIDTQQQQQPQLMDLSPNAFAAPPMQHQQQEQEMPDFEIAPQPLGTAAAGPPTLADYAPTTGLV